MVREVDRLGALEVRVAGQRPVEVALGQLDAASPSASRSARACASAWARTNSATSVATWSLRERAVCSLPPTGAGELGQPPLDRHVDVLVVRAGPRSVPPSISARDGVEAAHDLVEVVVGSMIPPRGEHLRVRQRLLDVVRREPDSRTDRRVERWKSGSWGVEKRLMDWSRRRGYCIRGRTMPRREGAGDRSDRQGRQRRRAGAVRARRRGAGAGAVARARGGAVLPDGVEVVRGDVTEPGLGRGAPSRAASSCSTRWGCPSSGPRTTGSSSASTRAAARPSARGAREAGARRLVHTSTIDVFHAEPGGRFDESRVADYPKGTAYERSKQHAEELVLAAARATGFEVVLREPVRGVRPGPGRQRARSTATCSSRCSRAEAAARAAARRLRRRASPTASRAGTCSPPSAARDGERYILCDRHVTLRELARAVVRVAGTAAACRRRCRCRWRRRWPPVGEARRRATGKPPLLPRGQLTSSSGTPRPTRKAQEELGWEPTPLEDGLPRALAAL